MLQTGKIAAGLYAAQPRNCQVCSGSTNAPPAPAWHARKRSSVITDHSSKLMTDSRQPPTPCIWICASYAFCVLNAVMEYSQTVVFRFGVTSVLGSWLRLLFQLFLAFGPSPEVVREEVFKKAFKKKLPTQEPLDSSRHDIYRKQVEKHVNRHRLKLLLHIFSVFNT